MKKHFVFIAHEFRNRASKKLYRNSISTSFKNTKYHACYSDSITLKGDLLSNRDIFVCITNKIKKSAFVICDLTSWKKGSRINPNALFESGIAFGYKKDVFWICDCKKITLNNIIKTVSDISLKFIHDYKNIRDLQSVIKNDIVKAFDNRQSHKKLPGPFPVIR